MTIAIVSANPDPACLCRRERRSGSMRGHGTFRRALALTLVAFGLGPLAAHAQLVSVDGGLDVYDPTANDTWAANSYVTQAADFSGGQTAFAAAIIADEPGGMVDGHTLLGGAATVSGDSNDFSTTGLTWYGAAAWVNYLNVTDYGGSNQWALPVNYTGGPYENPVTGNPPSSSQMAWLVNQIYVSPISASLFSQNPKEVFAWWEGPDPFPHQGWSAWINEPGVFGAEGFNDVDQQYWNYNALAVAPGLVSSVPEPATLWLMVSGLAGLSMVRRRVYVRPSPRFRRSIRFLPFASLNLENDWSIDSQGGAAGSAALCGTASMYTGRGGGGYSSGLYTAK